MRVVLTGGGTGGHVYPALALAEAFAADPDFAPLAIDFIGTRDGLESRIVPVAGLPLHAVRAAPLARRMGFSFARTLATNVRGVVEALRILHRLKPDVLVATGGYVSLPVVTALRLVRALGRTSARIAVLEPNAAPGLTNRLLAPLVDEVWYAVAPAGRPLRARERVVGVPVRASMRRAMSAHDARARLGLPHDGHVVVVMGGSQGARSINDAVAELAEAGLPAGLCVVIIAGDRDFASLAARLTGRANVTVLAYLDDPRVAYAAADLVVARAGASTLGELAATATPAILVPYPFATADHQARNAREFARAGAARVVTDRELDAAHLRRALDEALEPHALAAMRDAARRVARIDPCATIVARVKGWSPAKLSPS
ncbi:MAG: undecaprenyldiphospho-muramoylpentapeptide beta-N-acetylglucosaminyltransferase [Vulcanimicrobiaceae bacterium]